jgi:uncharacterized coiled-coil protein SlyX
MDEKSYFSIPNIEFWNEPSFNDNYIPKVIEIYYGYSDGELKDYHLVNLDKSTSLIMVKVDGQLAYIQFEHKEVLNRLDGIIFPNVIINHSKLIDLILQNQSSLQQIINLQNKLQEQQNLIESLSFQEPNQSIIDLSFDIGELKQTIEQQQKRIEQLKQEFKSLSNYNSPRVKNSQLQRWKDLVETQVKQLYKNLYALSEIVLALKLEKLKLQIEIQIHEIKNKLTQQIYTFKSYNSNI